MLLFASHGRFASLVTVIPHLQVSELLVRQRFDRARVDYPLLVPKTLGDGVLGIHRLGEQFDKSWLPSQVCPSVYPGGREGDRSQRLHFDYKSTRDSVAASIMSFGAMLLLRPMTNQGLWGLALKPEHTLPADVWAETSTDSLRSMYCMACFWKGSRANGYSFAAFAAGLYVVSGFQSAGYTEYWQPGGKQGKDGARVEGRHFHIKTCNRIDVIFH